MDDIDDHSQAIITDLLMKLSRQQERADRRKARIETMEAEHKKKLIESKKCIDSLSAELGKIKRKLKKRGVK